MAGLDSLKHFDDGGSTDSGGSGAVMKQGPGGKLSPVNDVVLSSEEQGKILQRMQEMYNRRNNFLSPVADAFSAGKSFLTGNIVPWKQQQMAQEQQDITNMQQMAAMRAQSQLLDKAKAEMNVGAGSAGAGAGGGSGSGMAQRKIAGIPVDEQTFQTGKALIDAGYYNQAKDLAVNYSKQASNADLRAESYNPVKLNIEGVGLREWNAIQQRTYARAVAQGVPRDQAAALADNYGSISPGAAAGAPKAEIPAGGGAGAQQNAPVSVRNNNPGNIVDPKTGEFVKYKTPEEGQAALMKDLDGKISGNSPAYKARFGDTPVTPAKLAEVWSPAAAKGNSAESTKNYGAFIAKELGIAPTETIPNTPEAKQKVAQAITKFEKGAYGETAPAAQVAGVPVDKTLAKGEEIVQPQAQAPATQTGGTLAKPPANQAEAQATQKDLITSRIGAAPNPANFKTMSEYETALKRYDEDYKRESEILAGTGKITEEGAAKTVQSWGAESALREKTKRAAQDIIDAAKANPSALGYKTQGGVVGKLASLPLGAGDTFSAVYAGGADKKTQQAVDNNAALLGAENTKEIFGGMGARIGAMLTGIGKEAKGVGSEFSAQDNIRRAELIKLGLEEVDEKLAAADAFKKAKKGTDADFMRSKEYNDIVDKYEKRAEKEFPSEYKQSLEAEKNKKQQSSNAPKVGDVVKGHRFKGGNPADKNNWEKI